jgi:hypothetical protein
MFPNVPDSDMAILTSNSDSTRGVAWKVIPPRYNFPEQPGTAQITTMASRRTHGTGGRILPHERDADNSVPIMDAKFTDLGDNYNDLYNETLQHDMKDITRKEYQRRNIKVAKFWGEHCPEYYPGSEHEMYRQKTFKIRKSSSMAATRKT